MLHIREHIIKPVLITKSDSIRAKLFVLLTQFSNSHVSCHRCNVEPGFHQRRKHKRKHTHKHNNPYFTVLPSTPLEQTKQHDLRMEPASRHVGRVVIESMN